MMRFIQKWKDARVEKANEEARQFNSRLAVGKSQVKREEAKMMSTFCPLVGGSCRGQSCVHFRAGYATPRLTYREVGGNPWYVSVKYPRCALWKG